MNVYDKVMVLIVYILIGVFIADGLVISYNDKDISKKIAVLIFWPLVIIVLGLRGLEKVIGDE